MHIIGGLKDKYILLKTNIGNVQLANHIEWGSSRDWCDAYNVGLHVKGNISVHRLEILFLRNIPF